jgi:DNA replication protein DnaC
MYRMKSKQSRSEGGSEVEDYIKKMMERIKKTMQERPKAQQPEQKIPEDGIQCSRCNNTGWMLVKNGDHEAMGHCPVCWERRQVISRLKKSGVSSADYARYTLDAFDGDRSPAAKLMKEMARRYLQEHIKGGPGFGVFGKSGMGKTHICIAVCHGLTVDKYEPHYYFSYRTEIPNLVKAARNYAEDYERAIHKWKTCQNLFIDDLFKLSGKVQKGHLVDVDREELRIIFDIINSRYLNHLTTIFSSEYSVNDITIIDEALGSRIYEMINPYGLFVQGSNQRLVGAK